MNFKNLFVLCGLSLALAACDDSPRQTSTDAAGTRQQDREVARDAGRPAGDARHVNQEPALMRDGPLSEADHKVAVERLQATHGLENRKCDGLQGTARQQCRDTADTTRDDAIAAVDLRKSR